MKSPQFKAVDALRASTTKLVAPVLGLLLLGFVCYADGDRDRDEDRDRHEHRPPRVPAELQVPTGNVLAFRATGVGAQIYVWTVNPTNPALSSWVFKAPHAVLLRHHDLVGIHFAGPSWEGNDGSKVVGKRLAGVTVDATAIQWLLVQATSHSGAGNFADVTYIQRLNTVGGLAPTEPGALDGQEAVVPYIADYVFYHATGR